MDLEDYTCSCGKHFDSISPENLEAHQAGAKCTKATTDRQRCRSVVGPSRCDLCGVTLAGFASSDNLKSHQKSRACQAARQKKAANRSLFFYCGSADCLQGSSNQLSLDVPPALKKLLLDDHAAVLEGGKLVPLPRSPTVTELLQRYVQESHDQRGSSVNEEEVAHGLRSYFDKSLEAVLLYRPERAHAAKALSGGLVASSVFGAEHLCRLFIKLPDLLAAASASEEQIANVGVMVQDVMLWMSDNIGTLFLPKDKYLTAP